MRSGTLFLHVILICDFNMAKATRHFAMKRLAGWFDEHGWVQGAPDPELRKATYKGGYEIRLSASPDSPHLSPPPPPHKIARNAEVVRHAG